MQKIIDYIKYYLAQASPAVHVVSVVLLSALVWANYHYGINSFIQNQSFAFSFLYWYGLLLAVYTIPFLLYAATNSQAFSMPRVAKLFVALVPAIFSWKMSAPIQIFPNDRFWNHVSYYPLKALVVSVMIVVCGYMLGQDKNRFGLKHKEHTLKPYWLMLLLMVPLVLAAASRPGFLNVYPKALHVHNGPLTVPEVLLFETAYGIDFFTIELFFRGFLVVYASRWLGAKAILPMAMFYCVIHFGKPLGECISSFFGGMLLGIVSYNSQSIWGGLLIHVGIAWMMEAAAFLFR